MKATKYQVSESELAILLEADNKSREGLRKSISAFVLHGLSNGLPENLMASAIAQHVLGEAADAMCVLFGMAADDVQRNQEALDCLILRIQKLVLVIVAEFVRTHMDDEDLFVSPDDRKRNDAAERADYEYDRDKEERRAKH